MVGLGEGRHIEYVYLNTYAYIYVHGVYVLYFDINNPKNISKNYFIKIYLFSFHNNVIFVRNLNTSIKNTVHWEDDIDMDGDIPFWVTFTNYVSLGT